MVKLVLSVDNEQLKIIRLMIYQIFEQKKIIQKDSWKQIPNCSLKEAQDVISNHDATKDEINDMYQKLLDAYNGLVTLNDKSGLTDLISKADQLQEKDYTKEFMETTGRSINSSKRSIC